MELVALLRILWRRRLLVLAGAAVVILLGAHLLGGKSSSSGLASLRLVIDTSQSQLAHVGKVTSNELELAPRASMLADMVTTEGATARIAGAAGVPADELSITNPALTNPTVGTPLPVAIGSNLPVMPYTVSVGSVVDELPIIEVDATAPDAKTAARLVSSTAKELQAAADPDPAGSDVADHMAVRAVSVPKMKTVVLRTRHLMALMAVVVVFVLWCCLVVVLPSRWIPRRRPRRRRPRVA